MERLTTRNIAGVAVFKESYDCERCGEGLWRLPNYGNGSPTDKLAEYEDLEEQGLLFRLPCKVGDKVYRPVPKLYRRISVMTVVKIVIQEDGVYFKTDKDGGLFKTSAIGKTFFITKEKAEAALEKMKGEEYDKS